VLLVVDAMSVTYSVSVVFSILILYLNLVKFFYLRSRKPASPRVVGKQEEVREVIAGMV
jgi:hypothetical protein